MCAKKPLDDTSFLSINGVGQKKLESYGQDFIDAITVPIYWIDHHTPTERDGIHYYNPRLEKEDAYIPTTRMAYEIVQQDLWIAGIGCVADWHLPDFKEELIHSYPALITTDVNDAG